MKIYHGTSSRLLASILKKGIVPRGRRKGHWGAYPSRPDMVYLSVAYPFYFASCAKKEGEQCLVFEIDTDLLDESLLHPDEDFIAQGLAGEYGSIEAIHDKVRDNLENYQHHWQLSLNKMGNCCYKGKIPPKAITKFCVFDSRQRPHLSMAFLDPTISILNYMFMSDKYIGMVQWMFEYIPLLPMAIDPFGLGKRELASDLSESQRKAIQYWEEESKNRTGIQVCELKN